MEANYIEIPTNTIGKKKKKSFVGTLLNQKYLMLMSLPWVVYVFIFSYIPLYGLLMAFQDYKPNKGTLDQVWVGLKHFKALFADEMFYQVMINTIAMSMLSFLSFFVPIIFALLLNEIRNKFFKRSMQTISYLPHFVSMVIIASLTSTLFKTDGGIINSILMGLGIMKSNVNLLTDKNLFWCLMTVVDVWKETGWGAILYLAAIAGIDQEIYEAATVDGAGRLRKIWNITIPCISPTIIVLLILKIGSLLSIGFEKQMLLQTPMTLEYARTLDYYTLEFGINMSRYSFGTAIGIFKMVVSLILVLTANKIAKNFGEDGIV